MCHLFLSLSPYIYILIVVLSFITIFDLQLFLVLSNIDRKIKILMGMLSLVILLSINFVATLGELRVGFYNQVCPNAEAIVRDVVSSAVVADSKLAAVLLRLHFHDCFVQGCDGSILIDNGKTAEKRAFGHQGVGGFEVIQRAKSRLESVCPGIVSCSDIVALAARDSIALARGPAYNVPTGRRDGFVSNISFAADMPEVSDSIQQLKQKFLNKGLTEKDLVLLSAAHTIGTTACFFMTRRLYNFFPGGGSDPAINPGFLPQLKATCPQNGDINRRLPIDRTSGQVFDKEILQNIRTGFAVLESDARLYDDATTRAVVDSYFAFFSPIFGPSFESDFVVSIVKMGNIDVKTGSQGEIRRVCSAFN